VWRRAALLVGTLAMLACACGATQPTAADQEAASEAAPSYAALFRNYFDEATPGHCARAGCHADPNHNVWLCMDKDTCYQGMQDVGLIDALDPPAARAAIEAWVAAGARND
jgi:hypothetical protein